MKNIFSKILVFGLIAATVLPMLSFSGAAAISGAISVTKTEVNKDDTVVISYQVTGNEEVIGSAQMTLFYDSTAFAFVSAASDYFDASSVKATVNADSTVRLTAMGGSQSAAAGAVFKVTFKPTAAAAAGTSYAFAFGSKGKTTLKVSGKSKDLISAAKSEEGLRVVSANVTVVEKPKYTVTYTDGVTGETLFADQTYTVESGKATPKFQGTPQRADYVFAGWSPAVANTVTKNVTYTATWKKAAAQYTVIYTDGVAGETVFTDQKSTVTEGSATPAFQGTPQRVGYVFDGWTPAVAGTVTANVTYTARWKTAPKQFTVTYTDGVDGVVLFADQIYTVNEGDAYPAFQGTPVREGYKFKGWNLPQGVVSADTVVTPIWEESVGVEYVAAVYTDGVADEVIFEDRILVAVKGSKTPLFSGEPTREGYQFIGWAPAIADTLEEDTLYTALWKERAPDYSMIFLDIGGKDPVEKSTALKQPDAGSTYTREFVVRVTEDGYSQMQYRFAPQDSIPLNTELWLENPDDGSVVYSGAFAGIPAELNVPLTGKAGETVRLKVTVTFLETPTGDAAQAASFPITVSLGERDACHCLICAVIRTFGGPYCCCHLCVFILILILIILALVGVIVWLWKKNGKPAQGEGNPPAKKEASDAPKRRNSRSYEDWDDDNQ